MLAHRLTAPRTGLCTNQTLENTQQHRTALTDCWPLQGGHTGEEEEGVRRIMGVERECLSVSSVSVQESMCGFTVAVIGLCQEALSLPLQLTQLVWAN